MQVRWFRKEPVLPSPVLQARAGENYVVYFAFFSQFGDTNGRL